MLRLTGTIGGERGELVFADATLTVGTKKTVQRAAPCASFELVTDEGTIRVEGLEDAQKQGKIELSGTYGELLEHPVTKLFAKKAPGDHVRASIRGFGLFGGDRISLEGEVLEERVASSPSEPGADGGLREAPRRVPSVVRASRIAIGEGSASALESSSPGPAGPITEPMPPGPRRRVRYPLETSTYVYAALGAPLFVGALVAGWVAPLVPLRAWLTTPFCFGLGFLLVALNRRLRAVHHASYVTTIGGARLTKREPVWGYGADWVLVFLCYGFWVFLTGVEPSPTAATVLTTAPMVLTLLHLVLLGANERAFRTFAALLLRAPAADPRSGRMVLVEGLVKGPETALRRRVEYLEKSETTYSTTKDGNTVERTSTVLRDREHTSASGFTLEASGVAAPIEVSPQGARVSFARREWEPTEHTPTYAETLVAGQPVCVLARFEESEGRLRAVEGGEESLFVWAGSRAQLVRAAMVAYGQLAGLALLACVPLLLGLYAFPFAARYRASGVVTSSTLAGVQTEQPCSLSVLAYHYGDEPKCSVALTCDGVDLYGGFGMGQMDCGLPTSPFDASASGADPSSDDGDPALRFSLAERSVSWFDGASAVTVTLDPASPSLWR